MLRFGACSQLFTFWFHWPFLFSPSQALLPEVKVLLPLLPALPLKLLPWAVYLPRAEGLYWEVAASCWCHLAPVLSPAPVFLGTADEDIWVSLTLHWCMFMTMDRQIFIPQHRGTIVGQYKPGNLSILFSINLGNAKPTSTLLAPWAKPDTVLSHLPRAHPPQLMQIPSCWAMIPPCDISCASFGHRLVPLPFYSRILFLI